MAQKKPARVELPPPPHVAITWIVFGLYVAVAIEGGVLCWKYPWHSAFSVEDFFPGASTFEAVKAAQMHICGIYLIESLLAIGPGWCAMSPGWTLFELLVHHVPYVSAVAVAFCGPVERWTAPMAVVMLTPANEGMFIAQCLGAPAGLAKFRRLFGFSVVSLLFIVETWTIFRNLGIHWKIGGPAAIDAVLDQIAWGGIYYHALLLRLYIKRWMRTRSL